MMRHFASAAFGLCLCATAALADSEQGVVVELYTAQGCSSCPPADQLMEKIVQQPGVIGLTLHVDYWDYIGWTDTFGQAAFSARQKAYASAAGERMVYTPQMIVGGAARVVGNSPDEVAAAITAAAALPQQVKLVLARQDGKLVIHAETPQALAAPAMVEVVQYTEKGEADVDRGENAGMSLQSHNIVTSWARLGDWTGAAPLEMVTEAGEGPVAVILQTADTRGPGAILAAARLK